MKRVNLLKPKTFNLRQGDRGFCWLVLPDFTWLRLTVVGRVNAPQRKGATSSALWGKSDRQARHAPGQS